MILVTPEHIRAQLARQLGVEIYIGLLRSRSAPNHIPNMVRLLQESGPASTAVVGWYFIAAAAARGGKTSGKTIYLGEDHLVMRAARRRPHRTTPAAPNVSWLSAEFKYISKCELSNHSASLSSGPARSICCITGVTPVSTSQHLLTTQSTNKVGLCVVSLGAFLMVSLG